MHGKCGLPHAEPVSEPMVATIEQSDSHDDLDEVKVDEDPHEVRTPDLEPYERHSSVQSSWDSPVHSS
jgi:hypothetical protein